MYDKLSPELQEVADWLTSRKGAWTNFIPGALEKAYALGQQSRALPVYAVVSRPATEEELDMLCSVGITDTTDSGSYFDEGGYDGPSHYYGSETFLRKQPDGTTKLALNERKKKRSMADVDCRVPALALRKMDVKQFAKDVKADLWRDLEDAGAEGYQVNDAGQVRRKESVGE